MKHILFSMVCIGAVSLNALGDSLDCRLINCDCDSIDAGLLTGPYQDQCRAAEKQVKESCANGDGHNLTCDLVAHGDAAFPTSQNGGGRPPVDQRLDQFAQRLLDADSTGEKAAIYEDLRPELQALEVYYPALALADATAHAALSSVTAHNAASSAFYYLGRNADKVDPNFARASARELLKSAAALDRGSAENPYQLYQTGKTIERLGAAGVGLSDLTGNDPNAAKLVEKAGKWVKAGSDLDQLRRTGEINAGKFVDDLIGVIPKEQVPALGGPGGKYFRDLMAWDQNMWTNTTDGLNVVAKAIETGKFDRQEYDRVSGNLNRLAQDGPWTAKSGGDFIKKTVEEIPVVGKILKAIWN